MDIADTFATSTQRPDLSVRLKAALNRNPRLRRALGIPLQLRRSWIERKRTRFNRFFDETLGRASSGRLVLAVDNLGAEYEVDLRSSTTRRLLLEGNYEPDLVALISRFADRNRDVIDVGANIGLLSVFFSRYISKDARVLAVEPVPSALELLRGNLSRNGCTQNVEVFAGMAGKTEGQAEIETIPGMEEYSSAVGIRHKQAPRDRIQTHKVQVKPLDTLARERHLSCGFLKIDTEGYEIDVLEGARSILENDRPVVFSEASDPLMEPAGRSVRQLVELLEEMNYHVSDASHPGRSILYPFDGEILALPQS